MKKKTRLLFSFFAFVSAVLALTTGCDMDLIAKPFAAPVPAPEPEPEPEPVEVSFLTILNAPSNARKDHVSNVFVSNQTGRAGACQSYDGVIIEGGGGVSTVKIPLAYSGGPRNGLRFEETGVFFVSFDLNIDAVTRITVAEGGGLTLNFTNGSAVLDASSLAPVPVPVPTLTITNLPANTQKNHFSNVLVHSSSGAVAGCGDYKDITVIREKNSASAMIPLSYNNGSGYFRETGVFIVSFTASIDYTSYFTVKESDKMRLHFAEGSAVFDASLIPPPPPPYLTVTSLNTSP